MKSCFFIGHRETDDGLYAELYAVVIKHIEEHGVTSFFVGGYGGFDRLASSVVRQAKKLYPHITLTLLLPYHPGERPVALPAGFDGTYYPDIMGTVPRQYAIVRANRYMVDHSDYLIAHAWHPASNARNLVEYAQRREKRGLIQVTVLSAHKA